MKGDENMHLYLVRHAESCQNADLTGDWHPDDAPLTEKGKRQAALLAKREDLQTVDAIYASTLLRAAQTAFPLADKLGKPVTLLDDAIERDTAIFGTDRETMLREVPCAIWREWTPRIVCEHETPDMLRQRAKRLIDWISERSGEDESVLLVTHCAFFGYPLRYALHLPEDEPFAWKVENASVMHIEMRREAIPLLHCAGDRGHLFAERLF